MGSVHQLRQSDQYHNPASVATLPGGAFEYCTGLRSVTFLDGVTGIADGAFYSCIALTNVTIPNSVANIGDGAFLSCTSLLSVTIPANVTSIGDNLFANCSSLKSVTIPDSVTNIGYAAFALCSSLTSVTIPRNVASIGDRAFFQCTSLNTITVDALNSFYRSVDGVLYEKSQPLLLQYPAGRGGSYRIPIGVNTIGNEVFAYCTGLTSVTIPNTVTNIGYQAFAFCSVLTNVTIPGSVASIGYHAFAECASLTAITVDPLSSFYNSVDGVLFDKSQTLLLQYPAGRAGSYTIPKGVTSIGRDAFFHCASLTSVTVPSTVTNIALQAFGFCTSLTSVYFQGSAPSVGLDVFYGTSNVTVYYLSGTMGWGSRFAERLALLLPWIASTESSFGVQTNHFGFTIRGDRYMVLVVEACTNLANPAWTPVGTNFTWASGSFYFNDPQWTNQPARFYRLRLP